MNRFMSLILTAYILLISITNPVFANGSEYGSIDGVLLSEDKLPLKNEWISLVPDHRLFRFAWHTRTDENGIFKFEKLSGVDYILTYGPLFNQGRWITVRPGETTRVELRTKDKKYQSITGKIAVDNKPVETGSIAFYNLKPDRSRLAWPPSIPHSKIQKDGRYRIDNIIPGKYLVSIRPPEPEFTFDLESTKKKKKDLLTFQHVEIVNIKPGQNKIDFTAPESELEVIITDHSGNPAPDTLMAFLSPREIQAGFVPILMSAWGGTDKDGILRFEHIAPGMYDLMIGDSILSPPLCQGIQLKNDIKVEGRKTTVEWKLDKPITLTLSLKVNDNIPEWSYIMLVSDKYPKLRNMSDNLFYFDKKEAFLPVFLTFPSGKYKVFTITKTMKYSCEASIVEFSENTKINPELVKAGKIKVVLKGNQKDIAGTTVTVLDERGNVVPRLYDPMWTYDYDLYPAVVLPTTKEGITYIPGVKPGNYQLVVEGTNSKAMTKVKADEISTVTINIEN